MSNLHICTSCSIAIEDIDALEVASPARAKAVRELLESYPFPVLDYTADVDDLEEAPRYCDCCDDRFDAYGAGYLCCVYATN